MRHVDLFSAAPSRGGEERLARLTRHLEARLGDFGPGGPEDVRADQRTGVVTARLPGLPAARAAERLEREWGVRCGVSEGRLGFRLSPALRFEDLDYLWGCLNELL